MRFNGCPLTKASEKGHSSIIGGVEDVNQIWLCEKRGGGHPSIEE